MSEVIPLRRPAAAEASLFIDDVFDAVVSLPPDAREAALRARCAGHPSVEAEVRQLLEAMPAEEVKSTEPARPSPIVPGAHLGRYRLEEELGAGATASVWRAFDEQLRTWTALKLLHPKVQARQALEAVMTEARAASRIISDHVVRIKSAGRFGEQLHYIDMALCAEHRPGPGDEEQLVIGKTLAETPLSSLDEILRVMAEAARGVDAAHRVGVLHRDLKPANILLLPVSRRALVTDFGLAAPHLFPMAGPDTPGDATVTMGVPAGDGKLVGTPCYMAPEQAHGRAPVRVSDVYSLGATLYALLTGQAPYQPRDLPPRPAIDTVLRVREEPPADIREVDHRVPERLARLVRKAMARDPRKRYPTAAALADDLDAYRAGRPTSLDTRRPLLRLSLWSQRHRSAVITGTVLSTLFVGILCGAAWLAYERRQLLEAVAWADARLMEAQVQADAAQTMERIAQERRADAEAGAAEALQRADQADQERNKALRSESDAERRWAAERSSREAAEEAQAQAMALAEASEAARQAAEHAAEVTEAALATAKDRSARVEAELLAVQEAQAAAAAALRQANVDNVELQLAYEQARATAAEREAELEAVTRELSALRERLATLSRPAPPLATTLPPAGDAEQGEQQATEGP